MIEVPAEAMTPSEYAEHLVESGVQPITVTQADLDAMMEQMAEMKANLDRLNAERGVPIDQVDGYRKQLEAHFRARKASRQDTDFDAPETVIAALPENPDDITAAHTETLHFAIEQWLKKHPGKELDYLEVLAGELHQTVLAREGKHGVMHRRVSELEAQVTELLAQSAAWKAAQTPNG